MESSRPVLTTRSSSTALSLLQQPDGDVDDMNIAQGLLNQPKIARRRTSCTEMLVARRGFDPISGQSETSGRQMEPHTEGKSRRTIHSSNTWTSSSGEILSNQDENDDRTVFVQQYNHLARKHGVRILVLDDYEPFNDIRDGSAKSASWFSRKILRRTSSTQSVKSKPDRHLKHKRSISDISLRLKVKKDTWKDKDLQELVRLCGLSLLYLPTEYAPGSLAVPTCFRATAQYLIQHAPTTRGVFRISGSHSTVGALYNHYCSMDDEGQAISGTVRCPTLPEHIRCDVHDVASAFKRFLSGLPGGILGSLPLFDSLISIQSQLKSDPELTRTKQSKIRTRLIALAIATLKSQYRRELICAVFGLLCTIGRTAETSRREDDRGRPLPTSDLMGYGPLGIVFGPLLVGDLLEKYTMRLANPHGGLVLLPISPPKPRKDKQKKQRTSEDPLAFNTHVDKIKVVNGITEMLITHWRDVVRHMKDLRALRAIGSSKSLSAIAFKQPFLRPSASESFALRVPPDWDIIRSPTERAERSISPSPLRRASDFSSSTYDDSLNLDQNGVLQVRKQRSRPRTKALQVLSRTRSFIALSPTAEETPIGGSRDLKFQMSWTKETVDTLNSLGKGNNPSQLVTNALLVSPEATSGTTLDLGGQSKDILLATEKNIYTPSPKRYDVHKSKTPAVKETHTIATKRHTNLGTHDNSYDDYDLQRSDKIAYQISSKVEKWKEPKLHRSVLRKNVREPEHITPSISNAPFSEITIARASCKATEGVVSGIPRRNPASEPGVLHAAILKAPQRRISKSYIDSPRDRNPWVGYTKANAANDPLARISREDDIASLAALAQALDNELAEAAIRVTEGRPKHDSGYKTSSTGTELEVHNMPVKVCGSNGEDSSFICRPEPSPSVIGQPDDKPSTTLKARVEHFVQGSEHAISTHLLSSSIAPTTTIHCSVRDGPNRGTHNSNVRALAARFNVGTSTAPLTPQPKKSPAKSLIGEARSRLESPKGNLVSPYTTNPTSPTRSQKSEKSASSIMTVKKSRSRPPSSSPPKLSTPRYLMKVSLGNTTPRKPLHDAARALLELRPQPSTIPIQVVQGSVGNSTPPSTESSEVVAKPYSGFNDAGMSGVQNIASNFRTLDGTIGNLSRGTILPYPSPPPVAHQIQFSRPPSLNYSVSNSGYPSATPSPIRSNSILYTQIRNLQRQLSAKTEEARALRQQLDARTDPELGCLSEQLREAKRDTEIWKQRAEIAEKQLKNYTKITFRSSFFRETGFLLQKGGSEQGSTSDATLGRYASNATIRFQGGLHMMDGAASSQQPSSEESIDPIVQHFQDSGRAASNSDYGIWMEQRLKALEKGGPHELE